MLLLREGRLETWRLAAAAVGGGGRQACVCVWITPPVGPAPYGRLLRGTLYRHTHTHT